jgi:membrane protein DedA with SNARE-associated domain
MSFESLIMHYGYPLLFLGVILEGETFVIIAAFLAHRGYLSLPGVILVAFLGTFAVDQFFFLLGRTQGTVFLAKQPTWQPGVAKAQALLQRYNLLLIIGFRFLYGLRTVTPLMIGLSGFSARRFAMLNALGGLIWTVVMAALGYVFGQTLEVVFADVGRYEMWIVLTLVLVGSVVGLYHLYRQRRRGPEA